MPVKHALLALLAERDLTGYELKLRFERVLGEFWQLNSGQVYSTLERLRRDGMVSRRRPPARPPAAAPPPAVVDGMPPEIASMPPEGPPASDETARAAGDVTARAAGDDTARAAFSIRPRGRRALATWLAAPVGRLRPVRDPLYVKVAFSSPEQVPLLLRALALETRRYREASETLRALVARVPLSHGGRVRWLVAEAARLTYEAQLGWLDCVQRTLAAAPPTPRRHDPRPLRRPLLAAESPDAASA
jgi:DNA-binding PadR family transcriptional regulator